MPTFHLFENLISMGVAWLIALGIGRGLSTLPWLAQKYRRSENERSISQPRFRRLGGVVIAGGFLGALLVDSRFVWDIALTTLVWGSLFSLVLGLLDDAWPLHWGWQLLGQFFVGGFVVAMGMTINFVNFGGGRVFYFDELPLPGLAALVTLFWIILIMNAVNWLDGADGLMGSVLGVALVMLALLALQPEVNQPTLVFLPLMLLGALLGWLTLNWYPAKLVAGSSGVGFLGFFIAVLAVYAGTKAATLLLVLAIPILDMCSVILTRLRLRRSLFLPDQNHLHHLLLALGWSPRQIASTYAGVTVLMGSLALSTQYLEKFIVFVVVGVVFFIVLAWVQWALHRHATKL